MQVWRLVAHHEESQKALARMIEIGRIAIGWSSVGDLSELDPSNYTEITNKLETIQPDVNNSNMAGPSLWNLYAEVEIGDQIIVTASGKRQCVFEITGPYIFDSDNSILGYSHQRQAALTDIDPEALWEASESNVAKGENVRWTLAKCKGTKKSNDIVHFEGKRYSVLSTAIERDRSAREKCIRHFGCNCQVCGMNFQNLYGDIGRDYIHVHHRVDLAHSDGERIINPETDLVPLCPNCHAMIHTDKPAMSVEKLKEIYNRNGA
ncbi:HNH endonuclease [Salinivibrio sp. EAGSL]|uniref:HNH endonuclease n=1 Tax=Salinivibrio sp. EAGSL TaxID=2738468 RepID=UPI00158A1EFB|nr:HNH endonuclease [Salinivibrio sp. EAGSL]NUY55240.1 HNH endonuclease [Salinivibrio sp. EAGSL]